MFFSFSFCVVLWEKKQKEKREAEVGLADVYHYTKQHSRSRQTASILWFCVKRLWSHFCKQTFYHRKSILISSQPNNLNESRNENPRHGRYMSGLPVRWTMPDWYIWNESGGQRATQAQGERLRGEFKHKIFRCVRDSVFDQGTFVIYQNIVNII